METYEVTRLTATRTARSPWRYWVLLIAGMGAGSGMVLPPLSILVAQVSVPLVVAQASQDVRDSLPPTGLPARWATLTTDTGDYASGHRDFARYTTPLLCVEAARTEAAYARRTAGVAAAAYTLQHTAPEQDTLPATVTRVARACGAHFLDQPVTQMDAADLPVLLPLALLAHQDTLAQAILARSAELAPTAAARQQVWLNGLDALLRAEPARVEAATALVAQWNRLGRSAVALQVGGASRFLAFWQQHFDRARMQEGAEALLQLEPDTTQPVATKISLLSGRVDAYGALWQLAAVDHPDSLTAVGQRVVQDLQRPVWDMPGWQHFKLKWVREFQSERHDADALRAFAMEKSDAFLNLRVDGQPMAPLGATYWRSPTDAPERDTVRPTPGRVSLFVRPDIACYNDELYESWGEKKCTQAIDRLARWQRMYGGSGLQITVVGYSTDGALYSGPLAPAVQADAIAWYVHQFAQLPVTVAVQSFGIMRRPAPDGTLGYEFTGPFDQQLKYGEGSWQNTLSVLTDRAGRVVYVGPDDAVLLDVLLAHLFAEPSSTPGMAPLGSRAGHAAATSTAPVTPVTP
jgi:hypothetical protein